MSYLLHPKHETFCQAYVRGPHAGNVAASYEAAGYQPDNANATRLAAQPHIKKRIAELISEDAAIDQHATQTAAAALGLDRQEVLSTLKTIGLANMFDYLHIDDDDRVQLDLTRLERAQGSALKSLKIQYLNPSDPKQGEVKSITVQMVDKRFALMELHRYLASASDRRTDAAVAAAQDDIPPWQMTDETFESYVIGTFAELAACGIDLRDLLDRAIAVSVVLMPPDGKPIKNMLWAKNLIHRARKVIPSRPVKWPLAA
jgi:hypothetical protein